MPDLTPERLDLIRSSCRRSVATSDKYPLITMDAADVLALLDAATERDALAAKLDADGQPVVHSDVEPHGSTPRKPLVIERVSSTLRIEGRQEPLGPAYLVMSADDDWGDSVRIDLGIQDARLLSGWLGSWLRNKA